MPIEVYDAITWPAEGVELEVDTAYVATVDFSQISATNRKATLSLVASDFTVGAIATLLIEDNEGIECAFYIPIVDTGDGTCTIIIPNLPSSAAAASLSIISPEIISITNLSITTRPNPLIAPANQVPTTFYTGNSSTANQVPTTFYTGNSSTVTINQTTFYTGNSSTVTINQTAGNICGILFNVSATTNISGFLMFNYTATDDAIISLDIVKDSTAEFYSPLSLNIYAGWHTLYIPVVYVNIAAGTIGCVVTAVIDTGTITIVTNQLVFTLTGNNITLYS